MTRFTNPARRTRCAQAGRPQRSPLQQTAALKIHRGEEPRPLAPMRDRKPLRDGASAFQPLVAFAVVAAALLNPVEAAVAVGALVLVVLIEARMHPRPGGGLLGIFGRHGSREYRFAGGGRRNCASWSWSRLGCGRSRCRRARRRRFLSRGLSRAAGQTFLYEIAIFEVCGLVCRFLRTPFIRTDFQFGLRHSRRGRERDGGTNRGGTESSKSRLHDDISLLRPFQRNRSAGT